MVRTSSSVIGLDYFNVQMRTEFKEAVHMDKNITYNSLGVPVAQSNLNEQSVIFFTVNDEVKSQRVAKHDFKKIQLVIDFVVEFDVKKYIFEYKDYTGFFAELGGIMSIVYSSLQILVPIYALMFFI